MARAAASDPAARAEAERLAAKVPAVAPAFEPAWRAWHRLHLDRPVPAMGGTPGRIPWRDVMAWADRYGDDAGLLDHFIMAMDTEYLDWCRERQNGG